MRVLVIYLLALICTGSCIQRGTYQTSVNTEFTPQIRGISFYKKDFLFLVTQSGNFLRTTDNGQSWHTLSAKTNDIYKQVDFVDEKCGWVLSDKGQVLSSTDGGDSWIPLAKFKYEEVSLAKINFMDKLNGWLIDPFSVSCTYDGGNTWESHFPTKETNDPTVQIHNYCFINNQLGWLCGGRGVVYRTTNGGKNWQRQNVISKDVDITSIFFLDNSTGWLCSRPNGAIYRSDDGGTTWLEQKMPSRNLDLKWVHFIDKNEGWAVGIDREDNARTTDKILGVVLHTIDGGKNWIFLDVGKKELFFDKIHFADSLNGWLIARNTVYRTNNAGKTWDAVLFVSDDGKQISGK